MSANVSVGYVPLRPGQNSRPEADYVAANLELERRIRREVERMFPRIVVAVGPAASVRVRVQPELRLVVPAATVEAIVHRAYEDLPLRVVGTASV